jgi:hypothetical protein
VATLIEELLWVGRNMRRRRNGTFAELRTQLVIKINEVFLLEARPIRQGHLAVLGRELAVDHRTVTKRNAVDVHHTGDAVRPLIDRSMGDGATPRVPDQCQLTIGRVQGVDHLDNRVDVVTQRDLGAVGVLRLHARQCKRMCAMSGFRQGRDDLVPR